MRQSELFTKTRREAPQDEAATNAKLLIRGGFIHKEMAGVYSFLPLGLRVLKKIEQVIREEINAVGGQELLLSSLHPKENWQKTGRWDAMDDLYKVKDSSERETALGPTHEEIIVPIAKEYVSSYKDLPFAAYQFQNKFRMELRAKSGILRGREFIMKDLYSFHADDKDFAAYYDKVKNAYHRIFKRVGIGEKTYLTYAAGGTFSKYSHEFQTLSPVGEDIIFLCTACKVAINKEILEDQKVCPSCGKSDFKEEKAVEVGNIFDLKTKFSAPFDLTYKNEEGQDVPVLMGCYGIGLGRLLGMIVEVLSDEKGMVWPEEVAPFRVHLLNLGVADKKVTKAAETLYGKLLKRGVEVLYDDRDARAGEKFADADLLGMPHRVVVSEKTVAKKKVEVTRRDSGITQMMTETALLKL